MERSHSPKHSRRLAKNESRNIQSSEVADAQGRKCQGQMTWWVQAGSIWLTLHTSTRPQWAGQRQHSICLQLQRVGVSTKLREVWQGAQGRAGSLHGQRPLGWSGSSCPSLQWLLKRVYDFRIINILRKYKNDNTCPHTQKKERQTLEIKIVITEIKNSTEPNAEWI